jgi:hypothetical protein
VGEYDALLRRYVLGALPEEERLKLEEQLISDERLFEGLGPLEHELMEEYLEGTLPEGDRRLFESRFLADPEHRQRLDFMRLVKQKAARPAASPSPAAPASPMAGRPAPTFYVWGRFAAAAVLALGIFGFWLCFRQAGGRPELAALRVANEATTQQVRLASEKLDATSEAIEELRRTLQAGSPGTPGGGPVVTIPTWRLLAQLSRGQGELPRFEVPADAQLVQLRLELPAGSHSSYRVAIWDSEDEEVCVRSKLGGLKSAGHVWVQLRLPADVFPRGDYRARVAGTSGSGAPEEIATFSFRVNDR